MKKRRLISRLAAPKAVNHVLMFITFYVMMICLIFLFRWEIPYAGYDDSRPSVMQGSYFGTMVFQHDFWRAMEILDSMTGTVINNGTVDAQAVERYHNTYMISYENMEYAVYDIYGEPMFLSDGFEFSGDGDSCAYLVMDCAGLEKYALPSFGVVMAETDNGGERRVILSSNFTSDIMYYLIPRDDQIGYVCAYVPFDLKEGDVFYTHSSDYSAYVSLSEPVMAIGICAFLLYLAELIFGTVVSGWSRESEGIYLYWVDHIYTEIAAVIIFFAGFWTVGSIGMTFNYAFSGYSGGPYMIDLNMFLTTLIGMSGYAAAHLSYFSIVRRLKAHHILKQSLIYKGIRGIYTVLYQGMINSNLLRKYLFVVFAAGITDLFLMFAATNSYGIWWWLLLFGVCILELFYAGKKVLAIAELAKGARKIAEGRLDYKIDTELMGTGVFLDFANNINNIGQGLNRAVDESIKSERMKADLITNVSHDIKTPLTSIINYVDLLKRENITQEPIREYIDILDSKSQRLKMLTEDLVEASRASSGNLTLEKNPIDFAELVWQIAGTYVEKYEQRKLELIIKQPDEPLMIFADGRRMYRILDNLFNNAFKYAMEGSRVYIDLYGTSKDAYFVMKNVSQASLNITADELTQRFVRGDESRTTEGSGLGLSIAKSLTELHGGSFEIYLDGDLFKVSICMERIYPKSNCENQSTGV